MRRIALAGLVLAGAIAACGGDGTGKSSDARGTRASQTHTPSASDKAREPIDFTDPGATRTALKALHREAGTGRPLQFFVDPEAGFAGMVLRGGASGTLLRVDRSGKVSATSQEMQADSQLSYSAIDTRAPARILTALQRDEGIEPKNVDAMIFGAGGAFAEGSSGARWAIKILDGREFVAGSHGTAVARAH